MWLMWLHQRHSSAALSPSRAHSCEGSTVCEAGIAGEEEDRRNDNGSGKEIPGSLFPLPLPFLLSFSSPAIPASSAVADPRGEGEGGNPVMSPIVSFDRGQARFDPPYLYCKKSHSYQC